MVCESIGRDSCSLRLVLSVQQVTIGRYPVSRDVETTSCFLLVFLPVSARDSILVASARGSVCLTSVRGIVVSLYLAFSMHARFLPFVCSLVG